MTDSAHRTPNSPASANRRSGRLRLRGGGPFDVKRLGDDDRVPKHIWWLAGGVGRPPTGKGLKDWKRKDGERKEREGAKREAARQAKAEAAGQGPAAAAGLGGQKLKGGFGKLLGGLKGLKRNKVVQPAPEGCTWWAWTWTRT